MLNKWLSWGSSRDKFENRLLSHVEKFFPVHWREVGSEHLRRVIRLGTSNAASYGLESQREIYLFVSLMLYLGSSFDTDDQLPWAAAGLGKNSKADSFKRIDATYELAVQYLNRVAGPGGQNSVSAMRLFRKMAPGLSGRSAVALSEILASIHPEKYRELSDTQVRHLSQLGEESARRYGLDAQGRLLCSLLAFLLGHGFATDPQFPWAAEVLNDPGISNPSQRGRAMTEATLLHLGRWFPGRELAP